ncbi:response regulator transcription factor [Leucobacter sp. wl10]|uniref:response regulator transcription factor n=1 Tax=Leucobacter sp. wl10 TaxID=2304677 RepID=UPI000E5A4BA8|nr:response regulator transcription factor [Leucobacter sp. wl10]RGE19829.1 DNA-binding response regulator [Leucobacter sp. wl10]
MRVLIVEDDRNLAASLQESLVGEGMVASVAFDGAQALELLRGSDVDIVLLDRDLPRVSGDRVCRELRESGHEASILMLTAAGTLHDRVEGLNLGADDYLAKPFAYMELLARMRALRRRRIASSPPILQSGGLRVDTARRLAERDGKRLSLSPKEFDLLEALMLANGGYVSRLDLLDLAWDDPDQLSAGVLKVAIHALRRKLGEPPVLSYRSGFGYRLEVAEDASA